METSTNAALPVPLQRLVRLCEGGRSACSRPGELVIQDVMGPLEFERGKPARPWVFRWYLCPHHRGAWNRTRLDHCKKLTQVEYVDDEILLPNSPALPPTVGSGESSTNQ